MSLIRDNETDTYATLWSSVASYSKNSPGEQHAAVFHGIAQDPGATVLDAGCGGGRGMVALAKLGYTVAGCDLTDAGLVAEAKAYPFVQTSLWSDLRPVAYLLHCAKAGFAADGADYVYACDVLEHLPTQFTMLAVDQMLRITKKAAYFSIYLTPDGHGPWVGRPLHLTVQPFTWWRDALREIADVVEARDCEEFGIYYVRPR